MKVHNLALVLALASSAFAAAAPRSEPTIQLRQTSNAPSVSNFPDRKGGGDGGGGGGHGGDGDGEGSGSPRGGEGGGGHIGDATALHARDIWGSLLGSVIAVGLGVVI